MLPPSPSSSGRPPNLAKRKRSPSLDELNVKRPRTTPSPSPFTVEYSPKTHDHHDHRPPPTETPSGIQQEQQQPPTGTPSEEHKSQEGLQYNPIAYWAETSCWPPDVAQRGFKMTDSPTPSKRPRTLSSASERHRADLVRSLETYGVFTTLKSFLGESGQADCDLLLQPRDGTLPYPPFPPEKWDDVFERISPLNEARFIRDMMPWLAPSAETLRFCGEPISGYIGEEVNARWTRCSTIAGKSQPDYVVGLMPTAFTEEERQKLQNMHTPDRPFLFTPELSYPFLICEAKDSQKGIDVARMQNLHYASVAVRAIVELYTGAFGPNSTETRSLSGQALAFSVSLNSSLVVISCHYAISNHALTTNAISGSVVGPNPSLPWNFLQKEILYCHPVAGSHERDRSYAFVRNVYEKFAPKHLERIQRAVAVLPENATRTGPSFDASELSVDDSPHQQGEGVFKKPAKSATALLNEQLLKAEKEAKEQLAQAEKEAKEQLAQAKKEAKEQTTRMEAQIQQLLTQLTENNAKAEAERQRNHEEQQQERQRMQDMMSELIRKTS